MLVRPPGSTRPYTLLPYTTLFRSRQARARHGGGGIPARRHGAGTNPRRHRRRRQATALVRNTGPRRRRRHGGAGAQAGLRTAQETTRRDRLSGINPATAAEAAARYATAASPRPPAPHRTAALPRTDQLTHI